MLGKTLGADGLMILTDVRGVAVDCGKASEKYIRSVSPDVLLDLGNHFPAGSMGPKVESAVDFVQNEKDDAGGGKWSMIGSLIDAESVMNGESGTLVTNAMGPHIWSITLRNRMNLNKHIAIIRRLSSGRITHQSLLLGNLFARYFLG